MIDLTNARKGVKKCIKTTMDRIDRGEKYTTNVLPTRYGKSDVIRVCAIWAYKAGSAGVSIVLSPNKVLRDQINDNARFRATLDRYDISSEGLRKFTLRNIVSYQQICANEEMLISSTMQLVAKNPDLFEAWVDHIIHKTGKPPIIFIDEAHTGSEDNTWGDVVVRMVDHGAKAVLLTATPMRSDGRAIPGFDVEIISEEPVSPRTWKPVPDKPEKIQIDIWNGLKRRIKLVANHETTFRQAWQEKTICDISRVAFDVNMSQIFESGITEDTKLSELLPLDARNQLRNVTKDSGFIRATVARLVTELERFGEHSAAIVFCGNDQSRLGDTSNSEDEAANSKKIDAHAKKIRKYIEQEKSELNVVIATSSDGNEGSGLIDKFSRGVGDVLIVKQMASLGLDVPRMKVCLDLSSVRTPAAFVQRVMRVATLHKPYTHAVYIHPADCVSIALFEELIRGEGGEFGISELELVDSYIKDREDVQRQQDVYTINEIVETDFGDTLGNKTSKDNIPSVEALLSIFPELNNVMTRPQIAERALNFKFVGEVKKSVSDTSDQCADLRNDINEKISSLCGKYVKGDAEAAKRYGRERSILYNKMKERCGINISIKLGDINDIKTLQNMKLVLDNELSKRGVVYETAQTF